MRALILVDIQNDFCHGGPLAVPDGDAIVPVANHLMGDHDLVVATMDWHPADHGSFAANHPGAQVHAEIDLHGLRQHLWPTHCVQWTGGAAFHPGVDSRRVARIFPKGTDPRVDSYSGFADNGKRVDTGLAAWLRGRGVDAVTITGLALDHCVRATAIDAAEAGFDVAVDLDGCRGVGVGPDDIDAALAGMRTAGVRCVGTLVRPPAMR